MNHIFMYLREIQAVTINDFFLFFFSLPRSLPIFAPRALFSTARVSLELRARRNSRNACKINRDARNSLLLATGNMCCPFAALLGWLASTGEMLD